MTQVVDHSQLLREFSDGSGTIDKPKESEKKVGQSQSHQLLSRIDIKAGSLHNCIIDFFCPLSYFLDVLHLDWFLFHEMTVNLRQLLEVRVYLIFLLRAMLVDSVGYFFLFNYSEVDGTVDDSEGEGVLVDESKTN